jgi:uncharacterized integral membrane protein
VRREPEDPTDAIPEGKPTFEYRRESAGLKSVALGTAALLLVIFILQNLDDANIDFLFWDWDVAIALPIGIAAVLGFVIGWSVTGSVGERNGSRTSRERRTARPPPRSAASVPGSRGGSPAAPRPRR